MIVSCHGRVQRRRGPTHDARRARVVAVSGLSSGADFAGGDRPLRRAHRVLGRRYGSRDGVRAGQRLPRTPAAAPDGAGQDDCPRAGLADRDLRGSRPPGARRARRLSAHPAGRPDGVSAPAHRATLGRRDRSRRRPAARRGAGGGQHYRRAPRQARSLRVPGAFPKCGWRCPIRHRRAVRRGCGPA